jgi:hypothetical protein
VRRFIDRGAITAGWVGIGMAVTIAASFLLIIPIEPIYWYLALPAGLLIGYYANARSARAGGPWRRIVANSLYAGVVTGLTYAAFLLVIKLIFFYADTGYPDFNRVDQNGASIPPTCQTGAECVYNRYLKAGQGAAFEAIGITDVETFTGFYWNQQLSTAGLMIALTTGGALIGGVAFGFTNRRRQADDGATGPAYLRDSKHAGD